MRKPLSRILGFTLLELLVVVALMAIVATVALVANEGVQDEAAVDATKYEMAELRKALLQFRRDTGVFPGNGAYACQAPSDEFEYPAFVTANHLDWCQSPANFWMLYSCPLKDDVDTPVDEGSPCKWNPDTKRGWNGPYLSKSGPGYVDVGLIAESDAGSELTGTLLQNVRGVADKFSHPPVEVGANEYLAWRLSPEAAAEGKSGRPYVLFDLDGDDARIISMGPDGLYNGPGSSACDPLIINGKSLDLVLCLQK